MIHLSDDERHYVRSEVCALNTKHLDESIKDCKEAIKELTNHARETNVSIASLTSLVQNQCEGLAKLEKKSEETVKLIRLERDMNIKQEGKIVLIAVLAGFTSSGVFNFLIGG